MTQISSLSGTLSVTYKVGDMTIWIDVGSCDMASVSVYLLYSLQPMKTYSTQATNSVNIYEKYTMAKILERKNTVNSYIYKSIHTGG